MRKLKLYLKKSVWNFLIMNRTVDVILKECC